MYLFCENVYLIFQFKNISILLKECVYVEICVLNLEKGPKMLFKFVFYKLFHIIFNKENLLLC